MVLRAAKTQGIPVSMCGEMAANPSYTRLLLGMGLTEFSVPPNSLLEIKQMITECDTDVLGPWAHRVLRAQDGEQQGRLLDEMNRPSGH
jgi:phosphotransferase system enzyme I (PtsI)